MTAVHHKWSNELILNCCRIRGAGLSCPSRSIGWRHRHHPAVCPWLPNSWSMHSLMPFLLDYRFSLTGRFPRVNFPSFWHNQSHSDPTRPSDWFWWQAEWLPDSFNPFILTFMHIYSNAYVIWRNKVRHLPMWPWTWFYQASRWGILDLLVAASCTGTAARLPWLLVAMRPWNPISWWWMLHAPASWAAAVSMGCDLAGSTTIGFL